MAGWGDNIKMELDIVGTVYHLVIYTVQQEKQSVLMSEFIHHIYNFYMFRTSPVHHQERFVQAVFVDCGKW